MADFRILLTIYIYSFNHIFLKSVLKKRKPSSQKALDHFDDFYKSVYGESWKPIRSALLSDDHKYVAVINNFGDSEEICKKLEVRFKA